MHRLPASALAILSAGFIALLAIGQSALAPEQQDNEMNTLAKARGCYIRHSVKCISDEILHLEFTMFDRLPGKLVLVGFGSVGQGVLPLPLRHLKVARSEVMIITADERGADEAARYGVKFAVNPVTRGNYRAALEPLLQPGDFLLNVSVDVSSAALIELCQKRGVLFPEDVDYSDPWQFKNFRVV